MKAHDRRLERAFIKRDAAKYGLGVRDYKRYLALLNHKKPRKVLDISDAGECSHNPKCRGECVSLTDWKAN